MKSKKRKESGQLRVVELFAGVGGFRLGLCGTGQAPLDGYEVVWANQWEPSTKKQHAADVYAARFHNGTYPDRWFNKDIFAVPTKGSAIPKHHLLVGGFPCQDYSVARTLSHAAGLEGKKGVLWWAIRDILKEKRPPYIMLENVDRLLKSPAKQRGRDFGIMLSSLAKLDYFVEWRVVNAADYGMPQRRRRVFILAYHKDSPVGRLASQAHPVNWLTRDGICARAFPGDAKPARVERATLYRSLAQMTKEFVYDFKNSGLMSEYMFTSLAVAPRLERPTPLGSLALKAKDVGPEYFISPSELKRWEKLKGAKKETRKSKSGFEYLYSEGAVAFPDSLDKPSRTIVTGEGGSSPSRFKHVIRQGSRYRRLTPLELEKLCMFPEDHTKLDGIGDQRRAFFMGNALVVGVIERLGRALLAAHRDSISKRLTDEPL